MHHLFLVRHGTTQWIEERRVQGATDSPLSDRGLEEARCAAQNLAEIPFDAVFCSPMGRARQTAAVICGARNLPIEYLDELHEIDLGIYEGYAYVEPPQGGLTRWMKIKLAAMMLIAQVSGESIARVKKRAAHAWEKISAAQPGGRVLVVAHGFILNALLAHLLPKEEYRRLKFVNLHPCALTELTVPAPGLANLVRLNDCDHLPPGRRPFS